VGQFGLRWNHIGSRVEHSFSYFEGFDHLPQLQGQFNPATAQIDVLRFYPKMRMVGSDMVASLPWLTLRSEGAWFQSNDQRVDEYVLYVIQAERQMGEWLFLGGYNGQVVTNQRSQFLFAPSRGLTRALAGRVSYTIDTNRSVSLEAVVRQNGDGALTKAEYSQLLSAHWRAVGHFVWLHGRASDFLGQYVRNSYGSLSLRYSF
jgi:hypothetical protein